MNKDTCNLNELKRILNVLAEEDLSATKALFGKLQEVIEAYKKKKTLKDKLSTLAIFEDVKENKK